MGINIDLLDRKQSVRKLNGDTIVDLTSTSVRYVNSNPRTLKLVLLSDDMRMRADVVSKLYYGSEDYLGHILKFNGISNPFAVNSGDILALPELASMEQNLVNPTIITQETKVRDQFIDESKVRENDKTREELDRKLQTLRDAGLGSSPSGSNLPPNIADLGDTEFKIRGGKIFFGGDVSKATDQCQDPISKSELRSRLIKNRLK